MKDLRQQLSKGAAVECSDGALGTVLKVDDGNGPAVLQVITSGGPVAVPLGFIRHVRKDGTIVLSCTKVGAREFSSPDFDGAVFGAQEQRIPLHAEELFAVKELKHLGTVEVRTQMEEVTGSVDVEALREEVEVEHVPVGQEVAQRQGPWREGDDLMVPVYEEQLVVSKRLIHKETVRVRRLERREMRRFEDVLRRDRLDVEHPEGTVLFKERFGVDGAP